MPTRTLVCREGLWRERKKGRLQGRRTSSEECVGGEGEEKGICRARARFNSRVFSSGMNFKVEIHTEKTKVHTVVQQLVREARKKKKIR